MPNIHLTKTFYLLFIALIIQGCSKEKTVFNEEKPVIIAGKIENYNPNEHKTTITLVRRDLFDLNEKMVSEIDSTGKFKFEYPIYLHQEVYLIYKNFITLAVSPGDSLFLTIDSKFLKEKNLANINFGDTDNGKINYHLNAFEDSIRKSEYFYSSQDAMKDKSPSEFIAFEQNKQLEYQKLIDKYQSENSTSDAFNRISSDFLKYHIWEDFMRYRWYHPYLNDMPKDSLQLPDGYFDFLKSYNMNDADFFSFAHIDFLNEFSMYSTEQPKDSIDKAKKLYAENKPNEAYMILSGMLDYNTSGLTNEIFYVKNMISVLNGQMLELFEDTYDSTRVKQPVFQKLINEEHLKLKEFLSNVNTGDANLTSISSSEVSKFMTDLVAKYKGKVIYVDFWAPWCSPCMGEMPYSTQIQEHYKNQDVVFLFLANRCSESSWKSTIANNKFTGEHILLTDKQFEVLSAFFDFNGIPHYVLIDRNGNVVHKDAPRPSDQENLVNTIDHLLQK